MMFVNLTDTGLTNTMILNHLNPQSRSARTVSLPARSFSFVNILSLEVDEICLHKFNKGAEAAS